ncbi:MAG: substrate-binding domain-containing protein [Actinophytocola sp.]|uniref:substrate-binding domain-containing protein n=1 Tax=Actinophytocola sp. TaxID=1872138 RepID=UPI0013270821|nr:substrate-binding domain-containing protein [Actinophytocola sp.]MPZ79229.1 substrate-binding domain-containing protein [Actinophytocola sp.]
MRRLTAMIGVATTMLAAVACGSGDDAGSDQRTIGMVNFTLGAPYFIGISKTVERAGDKAGVDVRVTDAKGDAATLTSNVSELLAQDVDGVIISGGPLEAAPAALNAIKQKGIPVVLVDRKFQTGEYTSWVGPDNTALGEQNGEFIAEKLGGTGKVAIIKGGPADNSIGIARTEGLKSVLDKESGIEQVEAPDFGEWSSDGGLRVMENLLARHADIDAVFCENDSMCLGAQKAVADAGRTAAIFLAGVDGQKEALAAIAEGGNYAVTGLNNAVEMGNAGYERLVTILDDGSTPEKDTVIPSPQITGENVNEYYDPNSEF